MKIVFMLLALGGMILALTGSDIAAFFGALGYAFAAFAAPNFWQKKAARRNRRWIAEDLAKWGYCPWARFGPYDPTNIYSRCKGAGYDLCHACIVSFLHPEED